MKYVIALFVAAIAAALAYIASDERIAERIRIFHIASDSTKQYPSLALKKVHLITIAAVVGVLSFAAMVRIQDSTDTFETIRLTFTLLCMIGAGCFDFRQKRIPNVFPLALVLGAVLLFGLGVALGREGIMTQITSSAVAAIACFVILTLTAVLTKEGIGAGDIKLIGALALMTGVYPVVETLFCASVLCSVAAIVLLMVKKKEADKSVPFGPFLLLGYIVTMLMNGI